MAASACEVDATSSSRVFAYMQRLHHRPCTADTPVVIHEWTHAGLGNALGQLLLSFHFALLHNRSLVTSSAGVRNPQEWVWTNGTGLLPTDVFWPSSCDALSAASSTGAHVFRHVIRMRAPASCPAYGCPWANALPVGFYSMCIMAWYTQLTGFLLRPSERLTAPIVEVGRRSCAPPLCGDRSPQDERAPARSWLAERTRRFDEAVSAERALMRRGTETLYRPPLALNLATRLRLLAGTRRDEPVMALHVRAGDACGSLRPLEHRPACVFDSAGLQRPVAAAVRGFWTRHRQAAKRRAEGASEGAAEGAGQASNEGAGQPSSDGAGHASSDGAGQSTAEAEGVGVLLLSTDSEAAFEQRAALAKAVGARVALGFSVPRAKYDGRSGFVETRLLGGALDARHLLAEALLDLGLLAQVTPGPDL